MHRSRWTYAVMPRSRRTLVRSNKSSPISVRIVGAGYSAAAVKNWVLGVDARLVRFSAADVILVCSPNRLPAKRGNQIYIAVIDRLDSSWSSSLRASAVDAAIALQPDMPERMPAIHFDGTISTHTFAEVVESAGQRPRVAVGTSVRFAARAEKWGDTHFARDLAESLRRLGWRTEVQSHLRLRRSKNRSNDMLIYIRGLRPCPQVETPVLTWIISHPSEVDAKELQSSARVFAAGVVAAHQFDADLLLQATNQHRFFEYRAEPALFDAALFVGSGKGRTRPSVGYGLRAGVPLRLVGPGWGSKQKDQRLASSVRNEDLHTYYSSARVVLNDHWSDMAEHGIISNRIFDALACGAAVLSDDVPGLDRALSGFVTTYRNFEEFAVLIRGLLADPESPKLREERRQFVLDQHTFDHRAAELDRAMRDLPA